MAVYYTSKQIHEVCRLLEEGNLNQTTISVMTGVGENTISRIINTDTFHKDIKGQYNIERRREYRPQLSRRKYSSETIHEVCRLLQDSDLSIREISEKTNVNISTIENIIYINSYFDISSQYNVKRPTTESIRSKKIPAICESLQDVNSTYREIARKHGVGGEFVRQVAKRMIYTELTDCYHFPEDDDVERKRNSKYLPLEKIHKAFEMLTDPSITYKEITKVTGVDPATLSGMVNGITHKDIGKKYNLSARRKYNKERGYGRRK